LLSLCKNTALKHGLQKKIRLTREKRKMRC
jgi:hypothetical protein